MERRKLQEVGGGTFTVSVPKEWAAEHGLEAGATVQLYTHGEGSVVVRSAESGGDPLAEARVELDGGDPDLATSLLETAHEAGFETVRLAATGSFSTETERRVRSTVRDLVGTEVVAAADDELTVRCLLDPATVSVDRTLVQLQSVALSVHRGGTATLLGAGDAARLDERRTEASRLAGMVTRHFVRSLRSLADLDRLGTTQARLYDYHETARHLDRVAEQGRRLARLGDGLAVPSGVGDEFGRVADATRRLVDDATAAAVGDGPVETARGTLGRCTEVGTEIDAVERALFTSADLDPATAVGVARALDALAETVDCAAAIVRVAVRAGIRDRNR